MKAHRIEDCLNAKYPNGVTEQDVHCIKGHKLGEGRVKASSVWVNPAFKICQLCTDFEDMNDVV